ncbi:MAG: replicative DNA helicase [Bacteroidetes bacterium]|nr:MAG: replicative DNA helicase [Bacteroidota bacterium]
MSEPKQPAKSFGGGQLKSIRPDSDLSNVVYGKIQPQALPLEEVVLGALLIDKDALALIMDVINAQSFYKRAHQIIYESMLQLFEQSQPIDLLTVNEALTKSSQIAEIGGVTYLIDLSNKVGSAANIEFHARIIAQKFIQRELIRVSTTIINDSFEDTKDVFELLDDAESNLFEITQQNLNRSFERLGTLAMQAEKQVESVSENEGGLIGVPTGFPELDKYTSGWQKSDLIIIAARPGMGKTAFTLALARNAAFDHNKPVAVFSLEMSSLQLTNRLISMESEISGSNLRNAQLEEYQWQQLHTTVEKMAQIPLFIDDTPAINIFELRAKCRRLKMQHDVQLIIIDYLQLMSGAPDQKRGNREQEISTISRSLKGMAKELEVPVIALSQLSRAVETRGGIKRPQLSDLRESGAIEQDADMVMFIYRPEYYGEEEPEQPKGLAEIILAKHRNGALGTVNLRFVPQLAKFENMEELNFDELDSNMFANDTGSVITRPSRLNDDEDIPF